jgi:bifunctional non-homologous end joining protein LigD
VNQLSCEVLWRGVSAQVGGGDRCEGALPRIRRARAGDLERQGAVRRSLDSRDKFDGYRVQLHIHNDAIKVFTRRGNDWTTRFSKIAADTFLINAGSAIIDGEVVVPAADGTTDFSVLQNELRGKSTRLVMIAFDLYLNGQDLRKLPLVERKTHLKKLIEKTAIQFSESFELDGKEMFEHACKVGLEGTPTCATAAIFPGAAGAG